MATREEENRRRRQILGTGRAALDRSGALPVPQFTSRLPEMIMERQQQANPNTNPLRPTPPGVVFDLAGRAEQGVAAAGDIFRGALRNPANFPFGTLNAGINMASSVPAALGFGAEGVGQAPATQPATPTGPVAGMFAAGAGAGMAPAGNISPHYRRILQLEGGMDSKGNFLRSSAGAWGPAQLMPGTAPEAMKLAGFSEKDERWKTDADVNIAAGAAYYDKQLRDFGDPAMAAAAYNAGPGRLRSALAKAEKQGGSWLTYLPQETQAYVNNFQAGAGGMPTFQNPWDPRYFQQAQGQIQQAGQALMQPVDFTAAMPDAPAFPDAPETPKRDWSETDQLLEAMRPMMLDETRQKQIRRSTFLEGMARGLASIPDGAGLGHVLAQIGAGMMGGRMAGDREIQARMDAFDEKMAAFQMLEFRYADNKADTIYQEAVREGTQLYQHNLAKWNADMTQFNRNYGVDVQGQHFVVRSKTDAGQRVQMIPIRPLVEASTLTAQAQLSQAMAGAFSSANNLEASVQNQYLAGMAAAQANRDLAAGAGETAMQGFVTSAWLQANEMYRTGMASALIGEKQYGSALKSAREMATAEGLFLGQDEHSNRTEELMISYTTRMLLNNPEFAKRAQERLPELWHSYMGRRTQDERRTTTTDSRGRVTERVQF